MILVKAICDVSVELSLSKVLISSSRYSQYSSGMKVRYNFSIVVEPYKDLEGQYPHAIWGSGWAGPEVVFNFFENFFFAEV